MSKAKNQSEMGYYSKISMKSCGFTTIINRKSLINERIVNGQNASRGEFPWMVSVIIEGNDSKPVTDLCGGAIIEFSLQLNFFL